MIERKAQGMDKKLWGGRFSKNTHAHMLDFHSSIHFDKELHPWDIQGSIAHAKMLAKVGVLTAEEALLIEKGLLEIEKDIEAGHIAFTVEDEDIHMNIERLLVERIGDVGKKLHTGRSRNDQVAVDTKLYVKHEVMLTKELLYTYMQTLLDVASIHQDVILPGYTHLQRAQPILFAHHLLAYVEMCVRDIKTLEAWEALHDEMPLGSGALAGTTFPLDRMYTAELLGFEGPCKNSLDGVSDRDFILDYMHAAAKGMMHLSRFSEEIILWSSQEFGFITLDDGYSTGSSMMPQKKNPDVAELVRGKMGRVLGRLVALFTTMKGLPLAYNKDMQEDKEGLFDTVKTWQSCLMIFTEMLRTMHIHKDVMLQATKKGFTNATDLADYLVREGMAFRDAHHVVGEMVAYALGKGISLEEIPLDVMQEFAPCMTEAVYHAIAIPTCVNARNTYGGTSLNEVVKRLEERKVWLAERT